MLKRYEMMDRHFGWEKRPKAATDRQVVEYKLERALRAQGLVSLDSVCFLEPSAKPAVRRVVERMVRRKELVPVEVEGAGKAEYWLRPETIEARFEPVGELVHILSPFDPLVIQRKRLHALFDYQHIFEAYVPKEKRRLGYFALPVLVGDEIVAAIDIKADRAKRKILLQKWTWVGKGSSRRHRPAIEAALDRFERFQIGD